MKILFVDDDKQRVHQFKKRVGSAHEIYWAQTVGEARKLLMDELFDLIMLDNDLGDVRPGYDGVAIAKFIRIGELQRQATFVVHSMNVVANKRIFDELNYAGYEVRSMPGGWKQVQLILTGISQ